MLNEKELLSFFLSLWNNLDDESYQKEKSKYLAKNNNDMVDKIYKISKYVFKSFSEDYNKFILEIEKREKIKENEESKTIIEKLEDIFLDLANYDSKEEDIFIALLKTDRGIFIPYPNGDYFNPYYNAPSSIGESQTCSAPYMVLSYNLLSKIVQNPKRIFEAGVGSGYQIANFAILYPESELFGIDIHKSLCETSIENIKKVDETNSYDLSKRIKIEQGNALKLEDNNSFKKNSPYDLIYFTFMLPLGYDIKNLAESEHLNKGGAIIAPVCEEIYGNLEKHTGCLNLVQKIYDKEILSAKVGYVSFVPAING